MTLETKNKALVNHSEHPISKIALFTRNYDEQGFLVSDGDKAMKRCSKCREVKPINEFAKNSSQKDGLNNNCKVCHAFYKRDHYYNNNSGKDRQKRNEALKKWRSENRERVATLARKSYHKRDKLKEMVRKLTRRMIDNGKILKQPCEVCKTIKDVEAHHLVYKKPVEPNDIMWLCYIHHHEWHFLNGYIN